MNSQETAPSQTTSKNLPPRGDSLITHLRYIGHAILFYITLLFNTIFSLIGGGKNKHGEIPISMPSSSERDENLPENFNSSTPNNDAKDVRRHSTPDSQAPSSLTNFPKEEPNGNHTVLVLEDETKALAEAVANDALSDILASSGNSELPEPAGDETKNTLVIKNLPFKFKQTDLDVLLNTYSAKPKNVRLMRDSAGRFTGIAFIRCPSKEEAGRLIQSMNNLDIGGRNIQVEFKKKKTKKGKLGESSASDSDFSNCSSLRSSAEYLNYNPEETNEPPREFLGARRMSLRTSAEYAREVIGREHLQTNLPIPNEPLRSNLQPAPSNLRRRPSFTPQTTTGMEAAFSQSYFQQQPFSIPNQRTTPRKTDLRKSTEEVPALYTYMPPNHSAQPPERRRSIATPEELSGFRNQAPARTGYIRPFTLTSSVNQGPSIQPIRQPIGPDGKTNGFSAEYRKSRTVAC